jgi:hypothetical protein
MTVSVGWYGVSVANNMATVRMMHVAYWSVLTAFPCDPEGRNNITGRIEGNKVLENRLKSI